MNQQQSGRHQAVLKCGTGNDAILHTLKTAPAPVAGGRNQIIMGYVKLRGCDAPTLTNNVTVHNWNGGGLTVNEGGDTCVVLGREMVTLPAAAFRQHTDITPNGNGHAASGSNLPTSSVKSAIHIKKTGELVIAHGLDTGCTADCHDVTEQDNVPPLSHIETNATLTIDDLIAMGIIEECEDSEWEGVSPEPSAYVTVKVNKEQISNDGGIASEINVPGDAAPETPSTNPNNDNASGGFIQQFECETCKKRFASHKKLRSHSRIHPKEKLFVCQHPGCERVYAAQYMLNRHNRSHMQEMARICNNPGCGKQFNNKVNLMCHKRTHTGQSLVFCEYPGCIRNFIDKKNLTRHMLTHYRNNQNLDHQYGCKEMPDQVEPICHQEQVAPPLK